MPLTIKVHEKHIPDRLWSSDAIAILNGEKDGDKDFALEELTYDRGYWVVTFPRTGQASFDVKIGKCRTEQEAVRKARNWAEKKQHIYNIDDTRPVKAVRVLYDEDELPDEYKCPAGYRDW